MKWRLAVVALLGFTGALMFQSPALAGRCGGTQTGGTSANKPCNDPILNQSETRCAGQTGCFWIALNPNEKCLGKNSSNDLGCSALTSQYACTHDGDCYWGWCEAQQAGNQDICNARTQCEVSAGGACVWKRIDGTEPPASTGNTGPGAGGLSGDKCFCYDNLSTITSENYDALTQIENDFGRSNCFNSPSCNKDSNRKESGRKYDQCIPHANAQLCTEAIQKWDDDYKAQLEAAQKSKAGAETKAGLSAFIPSCAYETNLTDECKDVGIFVVLLINISRYLFSIIGGLALLVFIYGGFIMILSQGNSEQVEKGKSAMTAAVIGLVVAFSGYLIISVMSGVVGVKTDFRL